MSFLFGEGSQSLSDFCEGAAAQQASGALHTVTDNRAKRRSEGIDGDLSQGAQATGNLISVEGSGEARHPCPDRAFVEGLERAMPKLRRFARSLTRSSATADDLVQDTMEKALLKHHQFQDGTNQDAWLFTILQNRFRSDLRRSSRRGPHSDIADLEHLVPTKGDQAAHCEMRDFARAFARLPEQERVTLYMVGVEGLSYEEAAEALQVEVGTIKSRTSRARHKITAWLSTDSTA